MRISDWSSDVCSSDLRPPATAASAEARLAELLERQELELAGWDVAGLAAARTRNDTARDAQGTVQLLETKIAGLTPTQPLLDLAAGPDALKLFVAGVPAEPPAADEGTEKRRVGKEGVGTG